MTRGGVRVFGRRWLAGLVSAALMAAMASCPAAARAEAPAGMEAGEVARMEERLGGLGYLAAAADSVYDADTRQALTGFQQANGLEATGEPDEATLEKLYSAEAVSRQVYLQRFTEAYREMDPLKNGDINGQVQVLQRKLSELGYFSGGIDGVFGDATQSAVERFQMVNGLEVTGVADGMTLMRLMAEVPITWQSYLSEMSAASGDAGLNVYVLQKKLAAMGYFEGECTGNFSDMTRQAVMQFQAANGLEDTGVADANTWALISSGGAVAKNRADVVAAGDAGERVTQIQQQLTGLGYYTHEVSGRYDYCTETAVRLFQMANELPSTGEADADTLDLMMGGAARPMTDEGVQEIFNTLLVGRSDAVQAVISEIAGRLVGEAFPASDDGLYPGFALVQYVCVAAGLPVTQPETLIRLASVPVAAASEVEAGNVVALQTEDGDSVAMLMTIGTGDGRVIYATAATGWVVMSYIDQMDSASVYRWAEGVETTE